MGQRPAGAGERLGAAVGSVTQTRSPAAAPVIVTFAVSPPLTNLFGAVTWTVAAAVASQAKPGAACAVARRH